ncbi:MAG: hypothetical protein M3324_04725, partial [Actinomycetota bacterium]|nr:hypothetical protein [Actinomycetota bacterium]
MPKLLMDNCTPRPFRASRVEMVYCVYFMATLSETRRLRLRASRPVSLSSLAISLNSPCCLNRLAQRSTDTIRGRSLQCRVRCGNGNDVVYLDGKDNANHNETG